MTHGSPTHTTSPRITAPVRYRAALLMTCVVASGACIAAPAQSSTDAEFRCESKVSHAGRRFLAARAACVATCIARAHGGAVPASDCFYPYGGATAACIGALDGNATGGVDHRFRDDIRRACDATVEPRAACPSCYAGGDCGLDGHAVDWVLGTSGFFDAFDTDVYCEPMSGASDAEVRCEIGTAMGLWKHVGHVGKCYECCYARARRGPIEPGACAWLSATPDPRLAACIAKADRAAIVGLDGVCAGTAPDSCGFPYPSGAEWVNVFDNGYAGSVVAPTYCAP